MRLVLVRHGDAAPGSDDDTRPLTRKGRAEIQLLTMFLHTSGISVQEVFHSGKVRAKETAEILAASVGNLQRAEEMAGLHPDDDVPATEARVAAFEDDTMLVGHLFHIQQLAASLLTGDPRSELLPFGTGTAVGLQRQAGGPWMVEFVVRPELLGKTELLV